MEIVLDRTHGTTLLVSAKYAVGSQETGARIGPGHRNSNWSQKTLELVDQLLQSVELDVVSDLFAEPPPGTPDDAPDEETPTTDGVPGL